MSPCLTWNPCRIGKPITFTHASKSMKESLYWMESIIHKEKNVSPIFTHPNKLTDIPFITEKI